MKRMDGEDYLDMELADDAEIDTWIKPADGWVNVSIDPRDNVRTWAANSVRERASLGDATDLSGGIAHLTAAAIILRATALPGTVLSLARQPLPQGPVSALWTTSLVPAELFPDDLLKEVRTFDRQGSPIGVDEAASVTLSSGRSARIRTTRAKKRPGWAPWRGEAITEGVTYMIELSDHMTRVVVDSWWQDLAQGDSIAAEVDSMANSLIFTISKSA